MDRYHKVEKPRPQSAINENEVRITTQGLIRNYVNYATSLLQEKRVREIVLKAMGQAISKTVAVAEIMKKRIPGLHQETSTSSVSITDVWEPIEEGLVPLETTRHVSVISITLSPRELNKDSPGYQAPVHAEQPKHQQKAQQLQEYQPQQQYQPRQNQDSYGRGRGRVRGRGRGWARGGYGVYAGYGNNRGGYGGYRNNQGGYGGYRNNDGAYGGYQNNEGGYGGYGHDQVLENNIGPEYIHLLKPSKMVDGAQIGVKVAGEVEGIGVIAVPDMNAAGASQEDTMLGAVAEGLGAAGEGFSRPPTS
ncbi:Ribonuclease P protein subunit p25-like protein [Ananas comosus]|uniref:Ribonuclease P protein subunit p25-like protein n=1 Tax=Ananas comosus TaxID=4615 RepID=A0A199UJM3_ANACO|nr:Ribonuclease P protein subunit p25-like protein [Ananas comosus]OAY82554.1 Ribonuclease P protein subunit p25-like protein [Ananas comosus]